MAATESPASAPETTAARTARDRAFLVVLIGLLVLVAGFTATLVSNAFYPCEPAAGSSVQPPLAECAGALSPWIGVAVVGLVLAVAGYFRVG